MTNQESLESRTFGMRNKVLIPALTALGLAALGYCFHDTARQVAQDPTSAALASYTAACFYTASLASVVTGFIASLR